MKLEIVPAFQPIMNSLNNKQSGFEVLARWTDGMITLEPYKRKANWAHADLKIMKTLVARAEVLKTFTAPLFINISNELMVSSQKFNEWLAVLSDLLWVIDTPIVVEVVENVTDVALEHRWETLEKLGLLFALDDFGRQHSTLERLKSRNWSYCKFDVLVDGLCAEAIVMKMAFR